MKRLYITLSLLGLLTACTTRQTTDATQSATSDSAHTPPSTLVAPAPAALSARLIGLGLNADHDWRQVNIGDAFTAAKATEKTAPFEQDTSHAGYSQEFDNLESVDYQYFQEGGKVNSIQVDLYLNTAAAVNAYQQDLTTYLTTRYGPPTAGTLVWKNGAVTLKDVSKGKDYGLKLVMK